MAPAIELQLCSIGKFAWLEGHTGARRHKVWYRQLDQLISVSSRSRQLA
jgi:hypothetical protein